MTRKSESYFSAYGIPFTVVWDEPEGYREGLIKQVLKDMLPEEDASQEKRQVVRDFLKEWIDMDPIHVDLKKLQSWASFYLDGYTRCKEGRAEPAIRPEDVDRLLDDTMGVAKSIRPSLKEYLLGRMKEELDGEGQVVITVSDANVEGWSFVEGWEACCKAHGLPNPKD